MRNDHLPDGIKSNKRSHRIFTIRKRLLRNHAITTAHGKALSDGEDEGGHEKTTSEREKFTFSL
jgi:hypothetical protein